MITSKPSQVSSQVPANLWKVGDRVAVSASHYGTDLQGQLGTVHRVLPELVEVLMDSGVTDVVAFRSGDLRLTKKGKQKARVVEGNTEGYESPFVYGDRLRLLKGGKEGTVVEEAYRGVWYLQLDDMPSSRVPVTLAMVEPVDTGRTDCELVVEIP